MHNLRLARLAAGTLGRPLFSWRHTRAPFDSAPSYYFVFLCALILGSCFFAFFETTNAFRRSNPSAGVMIDMDQYLWKGGYFDELFVQQTFNPSVRWVPRPPRLRPDVFHIFVDSSGKAHISRNAETLDDLAGQMAQHAQENGSVDVLIEADPAASYKAWISALDEVSILADENCPQNYRIWIFGSRAKRRFFGRRTTEIRLTTHSSGPGPAVAAVPVR